jgi:biotin carboxyl carrier protein
MADELDTLVVDDTGYRTRLTRKFRERKPWRPAGDSRVLAYIPGIVRKVYVSRGQRVKRGDPLLVLEAMKMQNTVDAPRDGLIRVLAVGSGSIVTKGQLLIEFE